MKNGALSRARHIVSPWELRYEGWPKAVRSHEARPGQFQNPAPETSPAIEPTPTEARQEPDATARPRAAWIPELCDISAGERRGNHRASRHGGRPGGTRGSNRHR